MIETQNLGKTFAPPPWPISLAARRSSRAARALHAVSLKVERGEIFGLMGPNGAGKTTLLRVLATLILPSQGWARVSGADVVHDSGAVRRAIGLAAGEQRGFYWRLNGIENMEFFAGLLGLAPTEARRRAERVLEMVDLLPYAREIVEYYSTGMRQRLGIARALLGKPRVLLLDEPTRSLDQHATQRIHDLIRHLAEETSMTVLLATHQPAEAAALCRRAAILVDGSILETVHLAATDEAAMAARYRSIIGAA